MRHFKTAKTVKKRPQTAKKRGRTVVTVTVRGETAGTGAGGREGPVVGKMSTQKDGFLRRFSAVLADLFSKRIAATRRRWW